MSRKPETGHWDVRGGPAWGRRKSVLGSNKAGGDEPSRESLVSPNLYIVHTQPHFPACGFNLGLKHTGPRAPKYLFLHPTFQSSTIQMPRNLGVALGSLFSPTQFYPCHQALVNLIPTFSCSATSTPLNTAHRICWHSGSAHTPT